MAIYKNTMKVRIKADVKELLTQGIPEDEAEKLSGQVVEATKEGGTYYLPVSENASRRPGASVWSFYNTDGRFIEELPSQGLDLTKPVQTRDGHPVEIKFVDDQLRYPVVGVMTRSDGTKVALAWNVDGSYCSTSCESDLVQAPEPLIKGWLNLYDARPIAQQVGNTIHPTKEKADELADTDRTACIKVSYRKGEGL